MKAVNLSHLLQCYSIRIMSSHRDNRTNTPLLWKWKWEIEKIKIVVFVIKCSQLDGQKAGVLHDGIWDAMRGTGTNNRRPWLLMCKLHRTKKKIYFRKPALRTRRWPFIIQPGPIHDSSLAIIVSFNKGCMSLLAPNPLHRIHASKTSIYSFISVSWTKLYVFPDAAARRSGYISSLKIMPNSSRNGSSSRRYSSYWPLFSTFALIANRAQGNS